MSGIRFFCSGMQQGSVNKNITFRLVQRVMTQLNDLRLGFLSGKLNAKSLNELAKNPKAQIFYDANTDNINVIQRVNGTLLRITTARDAFKIISVGPIREKYIMNCIERGRFKPIGNQLEESLKNKSSMNRIR